MKKIMIYVFIYCIILYAAIWTFNHINAWIGIAILLLTIGITIIKLESKIKQQ